MSSVVVLCIPIHGYLFALALAAKQISFYLIRRRVGVSHPQETMSGSSRGVSAVFGSRLPFLSWHSRKLCR